MEFRYAQGISHSLETMARACFLPWKLTEAARAARTMHPFRAAEAHAHDAFFLSIFFPGSQAFENPHTPKQIIGSGADAPGLAGWGRIRLLIAGSKQTILGVIPCLGAG
jgi:hypothetical protein